MLQERDNNHTNNATENEKAPRLEWNAELKDKEFELNKVSAFGDNAESVNVYANVNVNDEASKPNESVVEEVV